MEYKQILKRSWEITKTHKVLWIFGMAVAAFSGGSANFNFSGDQSTFQELFDGGKGGSVHEEANVLGAYTDSLLEIVHNIPVGVWILLSLSILLAVLAAVAVSLYIRNWAKGALIASIHDVEDAKETSLRAGSVRGREAVRRYIYLHVVPWLVVAAAFLAYSFAAVIAVSFVDPQARSVMIILFSLPMLAGAVLAAVAVNLALILAEQIVIRENLPAKEAFFKGFRLARKYLGKLIKMGAINFAVGCAVGCATVIVIAMGAVLIIIAFMINKAAGKVIAVAAVAALLIFILMSILMRGIYMVFNTATWTLLVREIEKSEREERKDGE